MCEQWIVHQCKVDGMDFLPTKLGKWWGADPIAREQTDIDIVAEDDINKQLLIAECKWRNNLNEAEAVSKLLQRATLVENAKNSDYKKIFMLFTKHPTSYNPRHAKTIINFVDAQTMFFN